MRHVEELHSGHIALDVSIGKILAPTSGASGAACSQKLENVPYRLIGEKGPRFELV